MDGTVLPDTDAMMINARHQRTVKPLPCRTICCSRWPSASVSRHARTGSAMTSHLDRESVSTIETAPATASPQQTTTRSVSLANVGGHRTSGTTPTRYPPSEPRLWTAARRSGRLLFRLSSRAQTPHLGFRSSVTTAGREGSRSSVTGGEVRAAGGLSVGGGATVARKLDRRSGCEASGRGTARRPVVAAELRT